MTTTPLDQWADWLLHRRHGDDPTELERTLVRLDAVRDRVLANGQVAAGNTLLDVGTGDGLIALGAMERVGDNGQVIFSDASQPLLDHVRQRSNRGDGLFSVAIAYLWAAKA